VSASDTTAIAKPPASIAVRSPKPTAGIASLGRPCGIAPTTSTPAAARPATAVTTVVATVARTIPTAARSMSRATTMMASAAMPTPSVSACASPLATPWAKAIASGTRPSASVENPKSFGSCETMTVSAIPLR